MQKGFSLGKENPKSEKNEACIKLVRRFLWKKPKAKRAKQAQGQREGMIRLALWLPERHFDMHLMGWHAVPGSLIPVPGTWYPVPGTRCPLLDHSRSLGYFRFHFQLKCTCESQIKFKLELSSGHRVVLLPWLTVTRLMLLLLQLSLLLFSLWV